MVLFSLDNLDKGIIRIESTLRDDLSRNRDETNRNSKEAREELTRSFHLFGESVSTRMGQVADMQKNQLETFASNLSLLTQTNEEKLTQLTNTLGSKLDTFREKSELAARENREELTASLKSFQDQFKASVSEFNDLQKQKFDGLAIKQTELLQVTEQRLEKMRDTIEIKLKSIQDDNSDKLERMRQTVDEKLHKTLEDKLGHSFQMVSNRLEQVQRGLGEMQTLANGVGDLKKVLSNIKTRGSLGEYRLEMILEAILAPEQYAKDVVTKEGSRENVEFAIKLPSKDNEIDFIWLPVDAKFPRATYEALLNAYEKADLELVEVATKELEKTIKLFAKDIRDKYLNPPVTTDFAIMFLPFEGLYAEVVKRPALFEVLQRDFRVNVAGPSTFAALIHSLQMGFRTLAIQKKSSQVWSLLGAIKTDFGKFATILDGIKNNLQIATNKVEDASKKSRTISRKLRDVEALPQAEAVILLDNDSEIDAEETNELIQENL
ncbi:DNA recombination protein RmuC [bacterium]|nr:DNA recombination protein RmuC [bacterium]